MREPWLAMALVFATGAGACDDSIYVEVRTGAVGKTDTVELFIGTDECTLDNGDPCNGVAPPGFDRHLLGKVFYRDLPDGFTQAVDSNGSAWFKFAASKATVTILAVGTSAGSDLPTGAASLVPQALFDGPLHIVANLVPPDALMGAKSGTLGVDVWRTHDGIACVGVGNDPKSRVFVVPETDRDCDDVIPANECDPLAFRTMTATPDPADPTCVDVFSSGTGGPSCQLGGATCNEITNVRSKCSSVNLCVPDGLCSACTAAFTRDCIAENFKGVNTTRLTCTIQVEPDGGGAFVPCTDAQKAIAQVDLDATAQFALTCTGLPTFASLEMAPYGVFVPQATVESGSASTVKLTPSNPSGKCKFDLAPTGTIEGGLVPGDNTPGAPQSGGIINMTFKPATGTVTRSILLPIEARFVAAGCAVASTCTIQPLAAVTDRVFTCGR